MNGTMPKNHWAFGDLVYNLMLQLVIPPGWSHSYQQRCRQVELCFSERHGLSCGSGGKCTRSCGLGGRRRGIHHPPQHVQPLRYLQRQHGRIILMLQ